MPAGTVCVAVHDGGMQRLVLFDVGRGTSEALGERLWVDDIGSWDGALLVKGHRDGDSTTVWMVEPSGELQAFAPLEGRGVHGLGVGPDGTVVVGVPYEGAGWWHRGTDLLAVSPSSELRLIYQGRLLLWYPTVGPDGSVAVLEQTERRGRVGRKRLLVVRPDGTAERPSLDELTNRWFPSRIHWGPAGLLALEGRLGKDEDSGWLAMAILDERFRVVEHFQEFKPHAWSPDGGTLLTTWRGNPLVTVATPGFRDAWTGPRFPMPVSCGTWLPPYLALRFVPGSADDVSGPPDVNFTDYRTEIIPAQRTTSPAGIAVVGAEALGGDGTVRVQLRGDHPLLGVSLDGARSDLYRLDTDLSEEGEIEIPSFVSDVQSHPAGPWLWIDANDTDLYLLERIPTIVTRHLQAAGITDATIDLDPDVDLL
jgi:hypothetical protein